MRFRTAVALFPLLVVVIREAPDHGAAHGLALLPAAVSPASPGGCGEAGSAVVHLTGPQPVFDRRKNLATGTLIDGRVAWWLGAGTVPVRFGAAGDICLLGAIIQGTYPDTTPWAVMHNTYAIQPYGPGAVIEAVRVHNYGDGMSARAAADNWTIRGSWFSFIRDDCIENDNMLNGLVEDVLYDGCYTFYSARRPPRLAERNGSGNTVTFRNVLARLKPMPTVYGGPAPGHSKFWKLDQRGVSPQIVLENVIFRVDEPAGIGGGYTMMIPPPGKLTRCTNVTLVWLGKGQFPEPVPPCYTVTTDITIWDDAVAAWHAAHAEVRDTLPHP